MAHYGRSKTGALPKRRIIDEQAESNATLIKFIQDRIKMAERHITELQKALFDYTEKTAKSRDCVDKIALVLDDFVKTENVASAFKHQMNDFANILLDVGTTRDAQVRTMETKVLDMLSGYEKLCGHVQNELKMSVVATEREKTCAKQLKKLRAAQTQDQEQSLAEAEFIKARGESAKSSKNLQEQIDIFEKKKLSDLKETLLAWTLTELHFHSKALQLFTDAYRIVADVDVNEDLEEFRNKLRYVSDTSRSEVQRTDSVLQLVTIPFRRRTKFTENGIPHSCSLQSSPRSSQLSNSSKEE